MESLHCVTAFGFVCGPVHSLSCGDVKSNEITTDLRLARRLSCGNDGIYFKMLVVSNVTVNFNPPTPSPDGHLDVFSSNYPASCSFEHFLIFDWEAFVTY